MKPRYLMLAALAVASLPLISACSTLSPELQAAATEQGRASAGVALPAWPARCASLTPHAAVKLGDQAVSALKRERGQLDKANGDKAACAAFYASLKGKLGAAK